jgi:hypothetical protein
MRSQERESGPSTAPLKMPLDATAQLEHNSSATFLSALAHPCSPPKARGTLNLFTNRDLREVCV